MGSHLAETIPQFQQSEYVFHFRFTSLSSDRKSIFQKQARPKPRLKKSEILFFLHDMHAYYAMYIMRMTDKRLRRYACTGTIYS